MSSVCAAGSSAMHTDGKTHAARSIQNSTARAVDGIRCGTQKDGKFDTHRLRLRCPWHVPSEYSACKESG